MDEIIWLIILYSVPLLICLYGYINARITKVDKIKLKYPGFNRTLKILHLSDIHLGAIHQLSSVDTIVREIVNMQPDVVVITGDLADGSLEVKQEWLEPFGTLSVPVLYVSGNHEIMNPKASLIKILKNVGIKHIGKCGNYELGRVNFIGIDFEYDLNKNLESMKERLQENMADNEDKDKKLNILLSHIPSLRPEELGKYNIFLFLAGHTHGGQVFPMHILSYWFNACFSGLYKDETGNHFVYVSEGVNNAVIPMRVGSNRIFAEITITG